MPRKFFRRFLPSAEQVRSQRVVAAFGSWLNHPNLWHLNRRSVAGAAAIGLFAGLLPGPIQMLGALLLVVPLRRNLPVALLVTLYTNPITIVPLYLLAYQFGRLLIGEHDASVEIVPFEMDWNLLDSAQALMRWMLSLGKPLAVGLPALATTLAVLGYLAVDLGWRCYVMLAWRARKRRRRAG